MLNLSEYQDYRLFLRDWINAKQATDPQFTWRYLSNILDIETSTLHKACSCKGNIPLRILDQIISLLQLSPRESQEFRLLVQIERNKNENIKRDLRFELLCLRCHDHADAHCNVNAQFFATWLHPVLFAILHTQLFCGSIDQVATELKNRLRPKTSLKEITQSLELLQHINLVQYRDNQWIPNTQNPNAHLGWSDGRIRNFQRGCMELAINALETQAKELRNISTLTLHLSQTAKQTIESELQKFRDRVKSIVESDGPSKTVLQLNIQLFSLIQEEAK